jgi:predicted methyltransferase
MALLAAPALARAQAGPALQAAVDSPSRTPANAARDPFRHPLASLTFWGLRPGIAVVEIDPGHPGYWSEILAPYAAATGGRYTAVPNETLTSPPIGPPGSADLVLTARNIHNMLWTPGLLAKAFKDWRDVLKPGGVLAIEEHRADPFKQVDTPDRPASTGYVSVAVVIEAAREAGFKLDAQSEINANPKDTKDHPFGVWTLPPTRVSSERGQPSPPGFDRAKYDAIGESDRMTLRFRRID